MAIDRAITEFERAGKDAKGAQEAPSAKPISWGQEVFSVIEWRRFEAVVEALFRQAGLETKSQSHGADGGVDVWLYSRQQPGIPVGLVQCKHWQGKQVGVDKIRELRGVMAAQKVERGVFATTSQTARRVTPGANCPEKGPAQQQLRGAEACLDQPALGGPHLTKVLLAPVCCFKAIEQESVEALRRKRRAADRGGLRVSR